MTSPPRPEHWSSGSLPMWRPDCEAARMRPGITDDDLAALIRMVDTADTSERRAKALDLLLDGLGLPQPSVA